MKIVVGSGKQYFIHRQLLCRTSEYFDRLFNGGFEESADGTMHKPDFDPRTFDIFVHWLYSRELPKDCQLPDEPDKPLRFLHMLSFANYILIPSLQAQCYARIRSGLGEDKCPSQFFIQELYNHDFGINHLRTYITKLCVYFIIHGTGHGEDWDKISCANPKFATDVAVELRQAHSKRDTREYKHPYRLTEFDKYPVENLEDSHRGPLQVQHNLSLSR